MLGRKTSRMRSLTTRYGREMEDGHLYSDVLLLEVYSISTCMDMLPRINTLLHFLSLTIYHCRLCLNTVLCYKI